MTREEAKELIPIIQAFAEGKDIEIYDNNNDKWKPMIIPNPNFICKPSYYRIKPESKYRPFKTQEECWNEILKHQPFGWVNYDDSICAIQSISPKGITITDWAETNSFYFEECLENLTFTNGTPFGIKEE